MMEPRTRSYKHWLASRDFTPRIIAKESHTQRRTHSHTHLWSHGNFCEFYFFGDTHTHTLPPHTHTVHPDATTVMPLAKSVLFCICFSSLRVSFATEYLSFLGSMAFCLQVVFVTCLVSEMIEKTERKSVPEYHESLDNKYPSNFNLSTMTKDNCCLSKISTASSVLDFFF